MGKTIYCCTSMENCCSGAGNAHEVINTDPVNYDIADKFIFKYQNYNIAFD